ncbi:hypothetical protein HDU85_001167 [Gaertneriomyces sp. JEL0708]|nr:hypothetical protein HDU85_001167 [Gaertneriomyces sp. JEL0708]
MTANANKSMEYPLYDPFNTLQIDVEELLSGYDQTFTTTAAAQNNSQNAESRWLPSIPGSDPFQQLQQDLEGLQSPPPSALRTYNTAYSTAGDLNARASGRPHPPAPSPGTNMAIVQGHNHVYPSPSPLYGPQPLPHQQLPVCPSQPGYPDQAWSTSGTPPAYGQRPPMAYQQQSNTYTHPAIYPEHMYYQQQQQQQQQQHHHYAQRRQYAQRAHPYHPHAYSLMPATMYARPPTHRQISNPEFISNSPAVPHAAVGGVAPVQPTTQLEQAMQLKMREEHQRPRYATVAEGYLSNELQHLNQYSHEEMNGLGAATQPEFVASPPPTPASNDYTLRNPPTTSGDHNQITSSGMNGVPHDRQVEPNEGGKTMEKEDKNTYPCPHFPHCPKRYASKSGVRWHVKRHHGADGASSSPNASKGEVSGEQLGGSIMALGSTNPVQQQERMDTHLLFSSSDTVRIPPPPPPPPALAQAPRVHPITPAVSSLSPPAAAHIVTAPSTAITSSTSPCPPTPTTSQRVYSCVPCGKQYQSAAGLRYHNRTKAHMAIVAGEDATTS